MSDNCYRYGRRTWPVALEGESVAILEFLFSVFRRDEVMLEFEKEYGRG